MKFLKIGTNKLKASLTAADLERYGIKCSLDPDSFDKKEVKNAVFGILEEAKRKCGFDIEDDKILIQLYPVENGACELFVTKLGMLSVREREELVNTGKVNYAETLNEVFRFTELDELVRCAEAMKGRAVESELYRGTDGVYYLKISENTVNGKSEALPIYEFGEHIPELPYDIDGERGEAVYRVRALDKLTER